MPQLSRCVRLIAVVSLGLTVSSLAQAPIEVKFKTIQDYMVVVPVTVNGAGPFSFLLDTGTSRTMVDSTIAAQLRLARVDTRVAVGVQSNTSVSLVHSDAVSMGGATISGLDLSVLPKQTGLPPGLSGILGEDFLENFDVLIDNRHHRIELRYFPGEGKVADGLTGERLPIRLDGVMDGQPTIGRLIVAGRTPELSSNEITMLLDSGGNSVVLFGGPESLGAGAVEQHYTMDSTTKSSREIMVSTKMVRQFRFGNRILRNLLAVAPPTRPGMDTDGLLPTSLFDSIYISHSQKFVIFDPATRH